MPSLSRRNEASEDQQQRGAVNGKVRKAITRSSPIHHLDSFLDKDGILRLAERILEASAPYVVKHPAILPKRSHVTDPIIHHFHQQTAPQGRARTQAEIHASVFWILNGSSTIGHHVSKCVTCRKLRGVPQQQKWLIFQQTALSKPLNLPTADSTILGPFT